MSDKKNEIVKKDTSPLAKILEVPIGAKAKIEIAIDRKNAKARVEILKADMIIKYGLLRKRKRDK